MRFLFLAICFFYLTGFYGCLEEKVNKGVSGTTGSDDHLIGYVDTRSGTGGFDYASGHTSPAASLPFGTIKLGPDTSIAHVTKSSSGYQYGDIEIRGFSHTRYSGTGLKEGGIYRVLPADKTLSFAEIKNQNPIFRHANEIATPGYYSVEPLNKKWKADLTATQHVGIHRYTFRDTSQPHILINLTSHLSDGGSVEDLEAHVDNQNSLITGHSLLNDDVSKRYDKLPLYFAIKSVRPFSHRFLSSQRPDSLESQIQSQNKEQVILDLSFNQVNSDLQKEEDDPHSQILTIYVGISYVSEQGAKDNLNSEVLKYQNKSFGDFKREAETKWEEILSRIRVKSPNQKMKQIFYSSLYRSFLMPTLFNDSDSNQPEKIKYRGFDKKIHEGQSFNYYGDFSLWDTFRTVHPLYNLIARKEQSDMMKSLILIGKESGRLPRWSGAGGHGDSMLGFPSHITISEAYQKGIYFTKEDSQAALGLMLRASLLPQDNLTQQFLPSNTSEALQKSPDETGRECMDQYIQYGYCPADVKKGSVSYTLEYSYSDFALSLFAKALGENNLADFFYKRSQNYRNNWSPQHLAFVPRMTNQSFETSFDLLDTTYIKRTKSTQHYFEGSPNQWRWYIPYDPQGLISLFSGNDNSTSGMQRFIDSLNDFFLNSDRRRGSAFPGPYYWHGNEPDIQSVYLFNSVHRPDLTQKWVKWIMTTKYSNTSQALDGDDDAGTLSAWYVLSSLGFFPIAGTTQYMIGSPLFAQAQFYLDGHLVDIKTENFSKTNDFVESVSINGKTLHDPWFDHSEIAQGATIVFHMSPQPVTWKGD